MKKLCIFSELSLWYQVLLKLCGSTFKSLFGQKPAKKTVGLRKKTLHFMKIVAPIRGVFLKLHANLTFCSFSIYE